MPAWTNSTQNTATELRAGGSTNQEIGQTLGFSTRTVERHLGPKMDRVPPPPTSPPGQPVVVPGGNLPWYKTVDRRVLIVGGVVVVAVGYLWYRRYRAGKNSIDTGNALSGAQYDYAMPTAGSSPGYSGSSGQGSTGNSDVAPVWLTSLSDQIIGALDTQNQTLADFVNSQAQAASPSKSSQDVAGGDPTRQRIIDLFNQYGVPLTYTAGPTSETPEERIARIQRQLTTGDRTYSQLEDSLRYLQKLQSGQAG